MAHIKTYPPPPPLTLTLNLPSASTMPEPHSDDFVLLSVTSAHLSFSGPPKVLCTVQGVQGAGVQVLPRVHLQDWTGLALPCLPEKQVSPPCY